MKKSGFKAELPEPITWAYGKGGGTLQLVVVIDLSRHITFAQLSKAVSGSGLLFPDPRLPLPARKMARLLATCAGLPHGKGGPG